MFRLIDTNTRNLCLTFIICLSVMNKNTIDLYIYIYRERERDRQTDRDRERLTGISGGLLLTPTTRLFGMWDQNILDSLCCSLDALPFTEKLYVTSSSKNFQNSLYAVKNFLLFVCVCVCVCVCVYSQVRWSSFFIKIKQHQWPSVTMSHNEFR